MYSLNGKYSQNDASIRLVILRTQKIPKNVTALYICVLLDADFDIITSAGVVFIGFHRVDEYPDTVETADETYHDKNRSGYDGENFLENPDKRAETDKQKSHDKKTLCVAF